MSRINDALKKAQEEKDSIYRKYGSIISASSHGKRGGKGKWLAALLVASIILLISGFLLTRYVTTPTDAEVRTASIEKAVKEERVVRQGEKVTPSATSEKKVDVETLYEKALNYQQQNSLTRAERLYRTILNRDPAFVFALNNLGVIYMAGKRDDEAKAMFEKAIEHSEDYVDPYYNLACIYSKSGDLSRSLEYLKRAIQLNNSVKNWAKNDKDLENLSYMMEFKEIME